MAPVAMRAGVPSMMAKPVAVKARASARAMPVLGSFAKPAVPVIAKPQVSRMRVGARFCLGKGVLVVDVVRCCTMVVLTL